MAETKKNFALIGAAGYVAPRHLEAIRDTNNRLIAALDPHDSVGLLDSYFPGAHFFTEFERFDRHTEKLRREGEEKRIHYVSICSPNYLHDAHIRFALRTGATPICEKPLVLNPWNLEGLAEIEKERGLKVNTILQLRVHPSLIQLEERVRKEQKKGKYNIDLVYVTPRGRWYSNSWKGQMDKAGGIASNIGIHFFDMLIWIFGDVKNQEVIYSDPKKMMGNLELEKANVRWLLSLDKKDLPWKEHKPFRTLRIDGEEIEFSKGFTNLHALVYKRTLEGNGFGIEDVKPSIDLVYNIRNTKPTQKTPRDISSFISI